VVDRAAIYQLWYNRVAFYNYRKVRQQQKAFMEAIKKNGVEVLLADEVHGCATQHYIRDIGFAIDDTFFLANPRRYYRRRELKGLRNLLPRFSRVARLESGTIEGGDVIVDEDYIIIGLGEETNIEGIESLRKKMKELKIDRKITTIEFTHRGIIHLDTRFNIPAQGIGLIHTKSFKKESLMWLEEHFDLVEATDAEADNIEINTFTLSPRKVVIQKGSRRLASLLEAKGIETIPVDYSEVTKLPGSFRCTTLPIEREGIRQLRQKYLEVPNKSD
jgi:N-dimethylarginine dimethylaminohydrolase